MRTALLQILVAGQVVRFANVLLVVGVSIMHLPFN